MGIMAVVAIIFAGASFYITSRFGWRTLNGAQNYHYGIDFGTNGKNLPMYFFDVGEVYEVGYSSGRGYYVEITIPRLGIRIHYYHLQKACTLTKGQVINKGDFVGYTGTTGNSTGVHLHLGVYIISTGTYVNPEVYFGGYSTAENAPDGMIFRVYHAKMMTGSLRDAIDIMPSYDEKAFITLTSDGRYAIYNPIAIKDTLEGAREYLEDGTIIRLESKDRAGTKSWTLGAFDYRKYNSVFASTSMTASLNEIESKTVDAMLVLCDDGRFRIYQDNVVADNYEDGFKLVDPDCFVIVEPTELPEIDGDPEIPDGTVDEQVTALAAANTELRKENAALKAALTTVYEISGAAIK